MNYVLYHKIPYYIGTNLEVMSMYFIWVFIDCPLCIDHMSLYIPDVLLIYCIFKIKIICILLSRLIPYHAYYVNDKFFIHFDGS